MAFLVMLVVLCAGTGALAGDIEKHLAIPWGQPVELDGVIDSVEWSDACSITVRLSRILLVKVRAKHDGENLLVAYTVDTNTTGGMVFPELVIDTQLDRADEWAPDDWWFHISATDCHGEGKFGDYSTCKVEQPFWAGVPNYATGAEQSGILNEFEMSISLEKLNIKPGDPIGIAYTVELVPGRRATWPVSARMEKPSTWGEMSLADIQ